MGGNAGVTVPCSQDGVEQSGEAGVEIGVAQGAEALGSHGAHGNHAGLAQHLEVVGEGCLGQRYPKRSAGALARPRERLDDLQSDGVAQRVEHGRQREVSDHRMLEGSHACIMPQPVLRFHCSLVIEQSDVWRCTEFGYAAAARDESTRAHPA